MRAPFNRKTKLHPRWDGPFVIVDSSDKDVYQLSTANGHILENLVNVDRLRKLDGNEQKMYVGEFWSASSRLKLRDERARRQKELHGLDVKLREATLANLEAQRNREPAPLVDIAEISSQRREVKRQLAEPTQPPAESSPDPGKRIRRLRSRFRPEE